MKTKILISLLTLTCLLAMPGRAQVNYAISGIVAYVASSPNASGNVVIASTYNGYPVASIGYGFNITWASGMVVVVEASTNLANPVWIPVETNTLTGGSSYFRDPQWKNHPARFYRLRSP